MSRPASRRAALALVVAAACLASPAAAEPFPWRPLSLAEALELARKQDKPVVVDVFTEWCEPCKRLERDVFGSQAVRDLTDRMIAIRIDAEKGNGPKVCASYDVVRYPTSLFLRSDGSEWGRIVGFRELPGYLETLQRFLDGRSPSEGVAAAKTPRTLRERFRGAFRRAHAGVPAAEAELRAIIGHPDAEASGIRGQAELALAELLIATSGRPPTEALSLLSSIVSRAGRRALADDAAYALALARASAGRPKKGLKVLKQRLDAAPSPPEVIYRVARFALAAGAVRSEAIELVRQQLDGSPEADFLWEALADLELQGGRVDRARAAMQEAARLRPDLPFYQRRLAEMAP